MIVCNKITQEKNIIIEVNYNDCVNTKCLNY